MWRGLYLVAGVWLPLIVFGVLQLLGWELDEDLAWLPLVFTLAGCIFGGGLWGRAISKIAQRGTPWKVGSITAITFTLITIANVLILGKLEFIFVEEGRSTLPLHRIFMLLFVPATAISCGLLSGIVGLAVKNLRLAWQLCWRAGLTGGLAFLVLNIIQELLGRKVGGLNAAATFTMISVTFIGQIGAMLAATRIVSQRLEVNRKR